MFYIVKECQEDIDACSVIEEMGLTHAFYLWRIRRLGSELPVEPRYYKQTIEKFARLT